MLKTTPKKYLGKRTDGGEGDARGQRENGGSPGEQARCEVAPRSGANLSPDGAQDIHAAPGKGFPHQNKNSQRPWGPEGSVTCGAAARRTRSSPAAPGRGASRTPAPSPPRPGRARWGTASSRASCHKEHETTSSPGKPFPTHPARKNRSGHPGAAKGSVRHHRASATSSRCSAGLG